MCSKDIRIILVRAEHPYVQSVAAHATGTVCSRGYRWTREGADPRSLVEGLKSAESLLRCSAMCSCLCPCVVLRCVPPFIEEGEYAGYIRKREERERKREKIKKKKPSRTAASFFSFMRVPRDAVDGDGDGSMSGSCSPLVLCLNVISWSCHSIPS